MHERGMRTTGRNAHPVLGARLAVFAGSGASRRARVKKKREKGKGQPGLPFMVCKCLAIQVLLSGLARGDWKDRWQGGMPIALQTCRGPLSASEGT